jgi:hypothetical protein
VIQILPTRTTIAAKHNLLEAVFLEELLAIDGLARLGIAEKEKKLVPFANNFVQPFVYLRTPNEREFRYSVGLEDAGDIVGVSVPQESLKRLKNTEH